MLLQGTYEESSLIATREKVSWTACVESILKHIGVFTKLAYHLHFSPIVKTNLINRFKNNLNGTLSKYKDKNEGKLRTYVLLKHILKKRNIFL